MSKSTRKTAKSLQRTIFTKYSLLIIALLATLLTFITVFTAKNELQRSITDQKRELVIVSNSINNILDSSKSALILASTDAKLQECLKYSSAETEAGYLNTLKGLSSSITNLSAVNNDILFWSITDKNWNIFDIKMPSDKILPTVLDNDLRQRLQSTRTVSLIGVYRVRDYLYSKNYCDILMLAKPVLNLNSGEFLGVCFAFLDEGSIHTIYSSNVPDNGTLFYLVSDNDILLSASNRDLIGSTYSIKNKTKNLLGYDIVEVNGEHYISNHSYISDGSITLYCLTPLNNIIVTSLRTILLFMVVAAAGLFIALLIADSISSRITAPLKKLTSTISEIEVGNTQLRADITGNDEIGMLSSAFNHMLDTQDALHAKDLQSQKQALENKFRLYQAQIVPHFLCNSLDVIISMMNLDMKAESEEMLIQLSEYYRLSLSGGEDIIPLSNEISLTKDYLAIQQHRYPEFFTYDVYVQCDIRGYTIPKLTLQPIVENAIYHGIKPKGGNGSILININENEEYILIRILDNGVGMPQELTDKLMDPENEDGFALTNINRRLRLFFGENSGMYIESMVNAYTQVMVKIPKEMKNDPRSFG